MKSYVKFAWIGHMDWINYNYVNVETALNQYQLVRNICHKCDQPYAALNGSSWVVQKSTACNFLYSSNKNSNETLLTAVASWIHWKFKFFIFLPARRAHPKFCYFNLTLSMRRHNHYRHTKKSFCVISDCDSRSKWHIQWYRFHFIENRLRRRRRRWRHEKTAQLA